MAADLLTTLYNACDPLLAASDKQWVDSNAVRGEQALTGRFCKALTRCQGSFIRYVFSGHNGSGKSSELRHLERELCSADHENRYLPIYIDAQPFFDEFDADVSEIFLAILGEVAAKLREHGIELADGYWSRKWRELQTLLSREIGIEEADVPLGEATVKLKLLASSRELRQKVRDSLNPDLPKLPEEIALVLEESRLKLKQKKFQDIVLIVDNLEKIKRFSTYDEGEPSWRELFIERAPMFTRMNVHLVLTAPLTLVRSVPAAVKDRYSDLLILPMIKVVERDRKTPYPSGREVLRTILEQRCLPNELTQAFSEEAVEFLITYSGGYVRDLMRYVRAAIDYIDSGLIDLDAARKGVQPTITTYAPTITAVQWTKLAKLELDPNQQVDPSDADISKMLEQTFVMEYINGGLDGGFDEAAPWYGVHPLLRELRQFKTALNAISRDNNAADVSAEAP